MMAFPDLTGHKYERLLVIGPAESPEKHTRYWRCICECGKEKNVRTTHLRRGLVRSCGCLSREMSSARGKSYRTHGMKHTSEYKCWVSMRNRCLSPASRAYENYGGRGITVCDRWSSFENFLLDMGRKPTADHSLDRINNDLGYSPENCRWATRSEQQNNKRVTKKFAISGVELTITEWAERLGIPKSTLRSRLTRGWSPERALNYV